MWLALPLLLFLAADFTSEGVKALEEHKYQEAADLFAKAVAADPGDYAANFPLALSKSLLGKRAEAIPIYKKVLELKPGLYEAELNLGSFGGEKQSRSGPIFRPPREKPEYRPVTLPTRCSNPATSPAEEVQGRGQIKRRPRAGLVHAQARQNRLPSRGALRQAAASILRQGWVVELARLRSEQAIAEAIEIYLPFRQRRRAGAPDALLIETKRYPEAIERLEGNREGPHLPMCSRWRTHRLNKERKRFR